MATTPALAELFWVLHAFSAQRGVHSIVNMGGVVKTLRRSNSLSIVFLVRWGPMGSKRAGSQH